MTQQLLMTKNASGVSYKKYGTYRRKSRGMKLVDLLREKGEISLDDVSALSFNNPMRALRHYAMKTRTRLEAIAPERWRILR